MPELPEVGTTLRGIGPHIDGKKIAKVTIRQSKLRWPTHPDLVQILADRKALACNRHAKYLVIAFETGILPIYPGMSGSLRIFTADDERIATPDKHGHLDFIFDDGTALYYHDPRKFGAVLWYEGIAEHHPLSEKLGSESLSEASDVNHPYQKLKMRRRAVKLALMNNTVVVGVGSIYASEGLFKADVSPLHPANKPAKKKCTLLVETIKMVLLRTVETGDNTLWDFANSDSKSGHFQQEYTVYGRHNEPCVQCGGLIFKETLGQRGTFHYLNCQK